MTDDPPARAFKRYLDDVEQDPVWQARQRRIAASRRSGQFRASPMVPLGLGLTAAALVVLAVLMWIGR